MPRQILDLTKTSSVVAHNFVPSSLKQLAISPLRLRDHAHSTAATLVTKSRSLKPHYQHSSKALQIALANTTTISFWETWEKQRWKLDRWDRHDGTQRNCWP